ncbi:MAG: FMN-binding protein [Jatrophihabitans sp.]
MKRVIFSVLATILGLVGLLSFKSHAQPVIGAQLPSAGLAAGSSSGPTATSAPPDPSSSTASSSTASSSTASSASTPSTKPTASSAAKTYLGSAIQTRYGTVQVQITVAGSKITNVAFVQLTGNDGRSNEINNEAAPVLLQETMDAQSSQIDTVSGATYTTDGYLQSLQSALDQAGRT